MTPTCPYCGAEMTISKYKVQEGGVIGYQYFCEMCDSSSPIRGTKEEAFSAALQRYVEPSAKTNRTCATCVSCKPSDKTNRLFCIYHGEYDHEHETYAEDYCSNWERRPTDEERQSVAWEGSE